MNSIKNNIIKNTLRVQQSITSAQSWRGGNLESSPSKKEIPSEGKSKTGMAETVRKLTQKEAPKKCRIPMTCELAYL